MASQSVELIFPIKGLHEVAAAKRQPEGTTPDCLNVTPFDAIEYRLRGGQRAGISKYFVDAVNGVNPIQRIDSVVVARDPRTLDVGTSLLNEPFTYADGILTTVSSGAWVGYTGTGTNLVYQQYNAAAATPNTTISSNVCWKNFGLTTVGVQSFLPATPPAVGSAYVIRATFPTVTFGTSTLTSRAYLNFRLPANPVSTRNFYAVEIRLVSSPTSVLTAHLWKVTSAAAATEVATANLATGVTSPYTVGTVEISVVADFCTVKINGSTVMTGVLDAYSSQTRVGWGLSNESSLKCLSIDNFLVFVGVAPTSLRETFLVAVSGGDIFAGAADSDLEAIAGGTGLITSTPVSSQSAFGKMYFADGVSTGYLVYDPAGVGSVAAWTPSAGDLPVGSVDISTAARFIARYRGRIVLYGLVEDPQNWYMSAATDPLDWDYAPSPTTQTQAVAGNNCDAGQLGDVLLCCAPYSDDLMVMGGDHSLWIMRGDPAAGGVIDNISYQTGIAGPRAFCWSPTGVLYFFGNGALWRMDAVNAAPVAISRNRLDKTFGAIDLSTYNIVLIWDYFNHGIHIFLTPIEEPAAAPNAYFWDERTDSFWKMEYPAEIGPSAVHVFDADDPNDRAVLLGGWDSYIRYFDLSAADDDSTGIASHVWYRHIQSGDVMRVRLSNLRAILATGSAAVNVEVHAAETPEAVYASTTPAFAANLVAGRNSPLIQRATGGAVAVKLAYDDTAITPWAIESMTATLTDGGKQRKGRL